MPRTDESRDDIVALHHRCWARVDATIEALDLDAVGHVSWWTEAHSHPTLQTIIVHMIAETNRHAGHADIIRETIDGVVGLRENVSNLPEEDATWWDGYHQRVEDAARVASSS